MISWWEIASWLLQTAAAAGVASTAFVVLLPTKFGEKYLSFHFDRKLAEQKDRQNQEIEKLKTLPSNRNGPQASPLFALRLPET